MVYIEDLFGNILEIYSHNYKLTCGAGAYQPAAKAGSTVAQLRCDKKRRAASL